LAFELAGKRLGFAHDSLRVRSDLNFAANSTRASEKAALLTKLEGRFANETITRGKDSTAPFAVAFVSNDLSIDRLSPLDMRGTVDLTAKRVDSLAPLVVGFAPLRSLLVGALGVEDLRATAALRVDDGVRRLDLVRARSGALSAHGYVISTSNDLNSKLLFKTDVANVGLEIKHGETSVFPLVSDEWLRPSPRVPRAKPRAAVQPTRSMLSSGPGQPASLRATGTPPL
jgi:hypothetical protein